MNDETIGIPSAEAMGADGQITTTERPNTSLFGIHSQLLELYELREDTLADTDVNPFDQNDAVVAINKAIDEYIALEARKVDSVVIVMRQFEAAAEFNKAEAKRYQTRAKRFEQEAGDIEQRLIRFMQANHLGEMQGKTARLTLAKNPASVNPRQPDLIPERFMRKDVTLSMDVWAEIIDRLLAESYDELARTLQDGINRGAAAPDLVPIKKEMQLECKDCAGLGFLRVPLTDDEVKCLTCGGSGKRAVAGCELVTDKVRLAVS